MKKYIFFALLILTLSCKNLAVDNQQTISQSADTLKDFREFKVLDSKYIDNDALWAPFN